MKVFRRDKSINQEELANLLNIQRTRLSLIENGKLNLTFDYF
ncbi:MAG: helix-turn-helix domain-containing protein [Mycoplasmataceae bacterium]|nr:helix-turn-helix domain-containing protein [Mycoplasmataceae bacterium]